MDDKRPDIRMRARLRAAGGLLTALFDRDVRRNFETMLAAYRMTPVSECACCGATSRFDLMGYDLHSGERCPRCGALGRHRLLARALAEGFAGFDGLDVLHFAPEPAVSAMIEAARPRSYRSADLAPQPGRMILDIEAIDLPDRSVDRVVCSHVLEHVDDRAALAEMRRILRPGGEAYLMVPVVEGWTETYEDPSVVEPEERHRHFRQWDHVRLYGADFRSRVREAGFVLSEYAADGAGCARWGIRPGERLFRARAA